MSWSDLLWLVIAYTFWTSFFLLLESWVSFCLLQIKIRDMRREWKRKKTYVYQGKQTIEDNTNPEALANENFQVIEDKNEYIEPTVKATSVYSKVSDSDVGGRKFTSRSKQRQMLGGDGDSEISGTVFSNSDAPSDSRSKFTHRAKVGNMFFTQQQASA